VNCFYSASCLGLALGFTRFALKDNGVRLRQ